MNSQDPGYIKLVNYINKIFDERNIGRGAGDQTAILSRVRMGINELDDEICSLKSKLTVAQEALDDVAKERIWDPHGQQHLRQVASAARSKIDEEDETDDDPDGMKQYGGSPNHKTAKKFDKKIGSICEAIDRLYIDGQMNRHNQEILDGMKATLENLSMALHDKIDHSPFLKRDRDDA